MAVRARVLLLDGSAYYGSAYDGLYLLWLYLLWLCLLWALLTVALLTVALLTMGSTYLRLPLAIPHGEPSACEAVIGRQPQHERTVHRRTWARVRVRVGLRVGVGVGLRVRGQG
jgi:hypothetical protein